MALTKITGEGLGTSINSTNTSGNSTVGLISGTSNSSVINLGDTDASNVGQVKYHHGVNSMVLRTNSTDKVTLDSTGNMLFNQSGTGIYLGTTSATAANLLDDYEEGTWTPSLGSYSGTPTFSNAVYVKSGNFVLAVVRVELDGTSDASRFEVAGLPFTVANTTNSVFGGGVSYTNSTFSRNIYVLVTSNSTRFGLYEEGGSNCSYTEVGTNKEIRLFVIYKSQ